MTRRLPLMSIFAALSFAACTPTIDGADFAGDDTSCSASFTCQGGKCGGVDYSIACTWNDANDIYDCVCDANGAVGETFSEAGVCEQDANGDFTDFDLADASAHAVDDCKFPVTAAAEEAAE